MSSDPTPAATGYVLKMYPRFSETFIVTEILAREAAGERLVLFSLRPPVDPRFHPELARVVSPVIYLERPSSFKRAWEELRDAASPEIRVAMSHQVDALLALDAVDAVQAVQIARAVTEHGLTHLHAHFGSVATSVARVAAALAGVPYSFTAHAKDIFHETVDPADLEDKLREAHHVVTVSDFNVRHLRERFPAATGSLRRVYNGLELDRFPFNGDRERGERLRVVSVGRLVEKKGFGLLIRAAAALTARGIALDVEIIGDGPLREELQALIEALDVGAVVRLTGPRPQQEIAEALRSRDVFAAPFVVGADGNADGLPTVLLEAMAAGIPCVAADVTGVPEVIRDGETGLLVPTGDVDGLIEALHRLAVGEVDTAALTAKARGLVEAEFDSARQAADLAALQRGGEVA